MSSPQGADELRVRALLVARGVGPDAVTPAPPVPLYSHPEGPEMLIAVLCLAALAPGAATAWLLREHGALIAGLAGAGVTVGLPFLLLVSLVAFPPLGLLVAAAAGLAALRAYDDGRVWIATAWAGVMLTALTCAGWTW